MRHLSLPVSRLFHRFSRAVTRRSYSLHRGVLKLIRRWGVIMRKRGSRTDMGCGKKNTPQEQRADCGHAVIRVCHQEASSIDDRYVYEGVLEE